MQFAVAVQRGTSSSSNSLCRVLGTVISRLLESKRSTMHQRLPVYAQRLVSRYNNSLQQHRLVSFVAERRPLSTLSATSAASATSDSTTSSRATGSFIRFPCRCGTAAALTGIQKCANSCRSNSSSHTRTNTTISCAFSTESLKGNDDKDSVNKSNDDKVVMVQSEHRRRFYCCFTRYDLQDVLDGTNDDYGANDSTTTNGTDLSFMASLHDLPSIVRLTQQHFDTNQDNIEFYHATERQWLPLDRLSLLLSDGHAVIPLRCADMYQGVDENSTDKTTTATRDEGGDENNDEHEAFAPSKRASELEETILFLVACLKHGGYSRANETHLYSPSTRDDDHAAAASDTANDSTANNSTRMTVATRDWVLEQADGDEELREILQLTDDSDSTQSARYSTPLLDHIVECLHYDFLWQDGNASPSSGSGDNDGG